MFFKVINGDHLKTSVVAMEPKKPLKSSASSSTTSINLLAGTDQMWGKLRSKLTNMEN